MLLENIHAQDLYCVKIIEFCLNFMLFCRDSDLTTSIVCLLVSQLVS